MRVIAGQSRGRKLVSTEGKDTRPTTDRVKESMFNLLAPYVCGANVLDLFAGSGQLGIEALSRGAKSAVFVDSSKDAQSCITENLKNCGFSDKAKLKTTDAVLYLSGAFERFDIAFLDPPYNRGILQKVLPGLVNFVSKDGKIVCESSIIDILPQNIGCFTVFKTNRYGKILITTYKHTDVI